MKQQLKAGDSAHGYNRIRLQQLIDGVVGNSLPAAMQHGSMVCNEVGKGVCLHRVSETFTSLVEEILDAVIDNSKKGDIHIRASRQHQRLILQITEKNNYNGFALAWRIGVLAQAVSGLGGSLDIRNPRQLETTISLSIPPRLAA